MQKITELWAYVAVDPQDDTEGLVAFSHDSVMIPMVCANLDRVNSLREIVDKIVL